MTKEKVKIKIYDDGKYVIRSLYRHKIDVYEINDGVYTINYDDLEHLPFKDYEIVSYKGFRGIRNYVLENKHFFLAFILCLSMLFILTRVVVKVEVIHSNKEIRELLEQELEKNGVHPFMLKMRFKDLQKIKDNIKKSEPDRIEWLEIIDEGMKYTIRVEERIITKEEEKPKYCDVVSEKDAIVLNVTSSEGQTDVYLNDYVKKGSTLISGAIRFNESVKSYRCATGEVYGNTWYTLNISVPYDYVSKEYTLKTSKNISFLYGSQLVEIFRIPFLKYDTLKYPIFTFGNFTLYKELHREYKVKKDKYSEDAAVNKALELGREKLKTNLGEDAEILDEKVLQRNAYDSIIEVDIFYSVKEKIGKQIIKEIPKEEEGVIEYESTERVLHNN